MNGEKIDLIDEILSFFQEASERFPRFKAETSIYEIKESLNFLKDFRVNNDSETRDKCLKLLDDYVIRLFYISLKKDRIKKRHNYAIEEISKAIEALKKIQQQFFNNPNQVDTIRYLSKEGRYTLETNIVFEELIFKLRRRQNGLSNIFYCPLAKANKYFDGGFDTILRGKETLKKSYTPLELSKAIMRLRVTIRNIFNNKPNIRLNSDKKA
jgi:hypothetical protein